jgi:hypothetical protein
MNETKRSFVPIALVRAAIFLIITAALLAVMRAGAVTALAADQMHREFRNGSPKVLLAVRAAALARVISEEETSNRYNTYTFVSFPWPTCIFEGGLCGALNRDGTIAVPAQFDWVGRFHDGRALVRLGGLYGYVDTAGKLVVTPQYELAGDYWRQMAEVDIGGKSELIDIEGRRVLEPKFARAIPFTSNVFWVNNGTRRYVGQRGEAELMTDEGSTVGSKFPSVLATNVFVDNGKWGLVDRTGAQIRAPEFAGIKEFDFANLNLAWARADAGWGLIKPDGTWFVEPKFEQVGPLTDNRAPVRVEGRWGYVDQTGNVVIAPKFEEAGSFHGMERAPVRIEGRWGYIDRTGTIVISPGFDAAKPFESDGLAVVNVGTLSGLIDRYGVWVIEPNYNTVLRGSGLSQELVWVVLSGKWGAFDRSGHLIISPEFSQTPTVCDDGWVIGFADGQSHVVRRRDRAPLRTPEGELSGRDCDNPFQIRTGNKFGYVDRALRPLTDIRFDAAYGFYEHAAVVKLAGKFGYINRDGTWLSEPRFDEANSFQGGAAVVKVGKMFGYIKTDGGSLIDPQYEEARPFENGVAIVKLNGKSGIVDSTGAWLLEPRWRRFGANLENGLVSAKYEDKWGFIDASGALVIDDKYDEFSSFRRGISWVKSDGAWCAIDRRGRPVLTLRCQMIDPNPKPGSITITTGKWP